MSFAKKVKKNLAKAAGEDYQTRRYKKYIAKMEAKFEKEFALVAHRLIQKVKDEGRISVTKRFLEIS